MQAVRSIEGAATVVDAPVPVADWPVLHVAAAGICGSDLGLVRFGLPVTLGHEIAGTVDGRAYCAEPTVACGLIQLGHRHELCHTLCHCASRGILSDATGT